MLCDPGERSPCPLSGVLPEITSNSPRPLLPPNPRRSCFTLLDFRTLSPARAPLGALQARDSPTPLSRCPHGGSHTRPSPHCSVDMSPVWGTPPHTDTQGPQLHAVTVQIRDNGHSGAGWLGGWVGINWVEATLRQQHESAPLQKCRLWEGGLHSAPWGSGDTMGQWGRCAGSGFRGPRGSHSQQVGVRHRRRVLY